MKRCNKCGIEYLEPLDKYFAKRSDNKDGLQNSCRECQSIYHKEHYKERTDYYKDKSRRTNAEYRKRNLQFIVDFLKEHPCVDCGEKDPIVLEFDHRERKDKECNISRMHTCHLDKLIKEMNKCDVRCSNCHKRKTAKQLNFYKDINMSVV